MNKAIRIVAVVAIVYVAIVVLFESLLGYFQPESDDTVVITTRSADGDTHDRVLTLLTDNDRYYVAANHWPRAWYRQALDNPHVELTKNEERRAFLAVPVTGAEHDRMMEEHAHSLVFLVLTGFPPRYFLRLDPLDASTLGRAPGS